MSMCIHCSYEESVYVLGWLVGWLVDSCQHDNGYRDYRRSIPDEKTLVKMQRQVNGHQSN